MTDPFGNFEGTRENKSLSRTLISSKQEYIMMIRSPRISKPLLTPYNSVYVEATPDQGISKRVCLRLCSCCLFCYRNILRADTFESAEDCCKKRFSFSYKACCQHAGCTVSTETLYYPKSDKCVAGVEGDLETWEIAFAKDSVQECCESNFWWKELQECQP